MESTLAEPGMASESDVNESQLALACPGRHASFPELGRHGVIVFGLDELSGG